MENPQRLHVQPHAKKDRLESQWVVGFVDGEGCFFVGLNPRKDMTAGYQILPEFTVVQHERDVQILHALKAFFGCGVVRSNHGDRMAYRVRSVDHLGQIVVPFFEKHSLCTKKHIDFLKFRDVILLMQQGKHLSPDGIQRIQEITSTMNRGMRKIKSDFFGNE